MIERMPRQLDRVEIRVLGSLLEKQQATPEYYPLTLNALVAACNQKNNRDPIMKLTEREISTALRSLAEDGLVSRDDHGRATRWSQHLDRRLGLDAAGKAVLTVLLLRGPQTAGEVRTRTNRLHAFATAAEAETALASLAGPPDPVIVLLERAPGQKEARWGHRVGIEDPERDGPPPPRPARPASASEPDAEPASRQLDPELTLMRIERLEQEVEKLKALVSHRFEPTE